jgi:hypothetical protein
MEILTDYLFVATKIAGNSAPMEMGIGKVANNRATRFLLPMFYSAPRFF